MSPPDLILKAAGPNLARPGLNLGRSRAMRAATEGNLDMRWINPCTLPEMICDKPEAFAGAASKICQRQRSHKELSWSLGGKSPLFDEEMVRGTGFEPVTPTMSR